jgi:hypothetical protein
MTDLENELLMRLANNEDIKSSDRAEDKARTKLKNRGLIIFDREKWRWHLTYAGQDAVYGPSQPSTEE